VRSCEPHRLADLAHRGLGDPASRGVAVGQHVSRIIGAEAGARRAFGKAARDLTAPEAALMAAMLPNPVRRDARKPSAGLRRLAGIYRARSAASQGRAACIRGGRAP